MFGYIHILHGKKKSKQCLINNIYEKCFVDISYVYILKLRKIERYDKYDNIVM